MPFLRKFPGGFRVHRVFQPKQFVMEVLYGRPKRPAVLSSVGKCTRDPDGAHGIQTVRILHDLPLQSFGNMPAVLAERYRIDGFENSRDPLFRDLIGPKKAERVCISLGAEKFVVVGVMKKRGQCDDLTVAFRLLPGDPQRSPIDAERMCRVVAARIPREKLPDICGCIFNQLL